MSLKIEQPVILVRVDDFPRWDLESSSYYKFDTILEEAEVPYTLGVTPWCEFADGKRFWINGEEAEYLRRLAKSGRVELALHGFTHKPRKFRGYVTEIAGYANTTLRDGILEADRWFRGMDLPSPRAFIPPFNTLTRANLEVLSERFEAVLTGPAALSSLGNFCPQVWRETLYLPSYRPLYDRAETIASSLEGILTLKQLHVVTLHWAWENRDGFAGLGKLLERLNSLAATWTLGQTLQHFLGQ